MTLSDNIKFYRQQRELSQKEICALIGINQAQYSRVENGKVEPNLASLRKIADALQVPVADLLKEDKKVELDSFDLSMIEKLKLIEELGEEEKKSIYHIIDIAIGRKRLKDTLKGALKAS
jgi:transcriptional regulator with XRE-family HTH domain